MLSLSLGRDGWVEAAAPAPRIECTLLRCAAFVAVQLFFVAHTRSCTIGDAAAHRYAAATLLWKGSEVAHKCKHPKGRRSSRINFALTSCCDYECNAPRCRRCEQLASCAAYASPSMSIR